MAETGGFDESGMAAALVNRKTSAKHSPRRPFQAIRFLNPTTTNKRCGRGDFCNKLGYEPYRVTRLARERGFCVG